MPSLRIIWRCGSVAFRLLAAALLAAATPGIATAARTVLFETFENDIPDVDINLTKPDSVDTFQRSIVVPPEGEPSGVYTTGALFPDPFGANNKSVLLYNPNAAAQMAVNFHRAFDADPTQFKNGVIEFDLFMEAAEPDCFWTFLDIRFGFDTRGFPNRSVSTVGDVTIWNTFRMQEGGQQGGGAALDILYDYQTQSTYSDQAVVLPDQKLHVRYDIDGTSHTYTVHIDNLQNADPPVEVAWPGVNPKPWYEVFNFTTFQFEPAPGFNVISFLTDASAHGQSQKAQNVYIDNLKVINNDLPPLTGADFDGDSDVDGVDFLAFQRGFGIPSGALATQGDADGNGVVDDADFTIFKQQFGQTGAVASGSPIPEPMTAALAIAAAFAALANHRRRRSGASAA